MLARTYKTADELGISQCHVDALFKVMTMLRSGELAHVQATEDDDEEVIAARHPDKQAFNMNFWKCGTVGCIGGWMESIDPTTDNYDGDWFEKLYNLFYPHRISGWGRIKTHHAAQAIDNYLQTGDPMWDVVMGEKV